jgi:S1-C subfamily serine protease
MTPSIRLIPPLAALAVALGVAACGGSGHNRTITVERSAPATGSSSGGNLQQAYVNVISRVTPEVVQIQNPQGLGSGVVFDSRGDIVTNAHVITGGGPFKVTSSKGKTYGARLIGRFVPDDLAVIRAQGGSLPHATFAKSRDVQVGEIVLAIGNPLGLRSSVTDGIVSAIGREVAEPNNVVLPSVVQTSAPINPGNSGGALVDLQGQVVGIPTLAATDPELGGSAAPGIGFAIPSSVATDIAGQIIRHGHVVESHRAYLGVELATEASGGAVVAAVQRGGPAERAGMRAGDVITSIDGQSISSPGDVATVLAKLRPGQTVTVGVVHQSGGRASLHVKLGQYPGS